MRSRVGLWLVCAAILGTGAPAAAEEPTPPRTRVAIVNAVDLPESLNDIRADLRMALVASVTKHGYEVASDSGTCADPECLKAAASTTGATDILVATGGRNEMRGYHVELRLRNLASDREDHAVAECNICAALQMVENVGTVADQLLERVPALHASPPVAAAPPPVPVPPPPAPPPPAPVLVGGPSPPSDHAGHRWLGWPLLGVGVASGVASGVLFAIDNQNGDCHTGLAGGVDPCLKQRDTLAPALITAGVAAAAITSGLVFLFTGEDHPGLALGVQPFGVTVGGRL